jgi:hypothetical protein
MSIKQHNTLLMDSHTLKMSIHTHVRIWHTAFVTRALQERLKGIVADRLSHKMSVTENAKAVEQGLKVVEGLAQTKDARQTCH